jgi:exodeoxyribonuclease-3
MDRFLAAGFVDTFRAVHPELCAYTWWSPRAGARPRNVGWRLDYVYVDAAHAHRVKEAFIRSEVPGSDHCPVGITLAV